MTIDELIDQTNGKVIRVTGPDAGQCTAVPHWWERGLGLPIVYGDAKDTFANAGADYERSENSPTNFPPVGAVMVWDQTWGAGYGHTGVVTSATADEFWTLEQNNPTESATRLVNHKTYKGVTGWFTPRVLMQEAKQGTTDMLDSENELQALFRAFRGRGATPAEVNQYLGKVSYAVMVQSLDSGSERDGVATALQVGQVAVAAGWKQQLVDLKAQLLSQQDVIAAQAKQLSALQTANFSNVSVRTSDTIPATKRENFFSTTQGRAVLGALAAIALPAINVFQTGGVSSETAQVAGAVAIAAALQTLKDYLNPGVPNSTK